MQTSIKPSEEMIWKKYYSEEAKTFDYPKSTLYEAVYDENIKRKDSIAIEYEGTKVRYGDFLKMLKEQQKTYKD